MKRQKLLIVEQRQAAFSAFESALGSEYQILRAVSADEMYSCLKEELPYAILLAVRLKHADALKLLKDLKADARYCMIPVLAIVESGDSKEAKAALDLGAADMAASYLPGKALLARLKNLRTFEIGSPTELQNRLDETSKRLDVLTNLVPGAVAIYKFSQREITPLYFSDGVYALSGHTKEEYEQLVQECGALAPVYEEDIPGLIGGVQAAIQSNRSLNLQYRLRHKNGNLIWVNLIGEKIEEDGEYSIFHVVIIDITEEIDIRSTLEKINDEMRYNLDHDPLTRLYNREAFCRNTAELIQRNFDKKYVLISFDISKFKVINDLFGKATGDVMLQNIGETLLKRLGDQGTCGRFEADNFFACYPESQFDIDRVLTNLTACFSSLKPSFEAVVYIGIYVIDDITVSVDLMCDRANLALETVKGNYLKRYAYYDGVLRSGMLAEQEIVSEMTDALNSGQFQPYFQPIYSVTEDRAVSAEALVRWIDPLNGIIPPSSFIPLFEKNGFIARLDAYMWEEVCKYQRQCLDSGIQPVPISVNVSRMNFYNQSLADEMLSVVKKYDLDTTLVRIEITESAYMDDAAQLLNTVANFQNKGFQVYMDDFGSGFSSLNMLKDVPVDILKIDMRFIDDVESSNRAGNVLSSVVRMAKWLDIRVIAEGVETSSQVDFLRSIGCDYMQGYYFSKPMSKDEFTQLLKSCVRLENKRSGREGNVPNLDTLLTADWESNLLFNSMVGAIGIYELLGDKLEILRVNDGYYELMDSSPQLVYTDGRHALQYLNEGDKQKILSLCRGAKETHKVEESLVTRYKPSGKVIWLNVKVKYLGQLSGQRDLYMFVMDDVSSRKKEEHEQEMSRYNASLLSVYDEILEMDFVKNISSVIYFKLDFGSSELSSGDFKSAFHSWILKYVHPDDLETVIDFFDDEFLENCKNKPPVLDYRLVRENSVERWCRSTMLKMDEGVYLCCSNDITARKTADLLLEQNAMLRAEKQVEDRYRIVVEQTDTIIFEWDMEKNLFFSSPNFTRLMMSTVPPDVLFSNHGPREFVYFEDHPALEKFFEDMNSREGTVGVELRLQMKDKNFVWCRMTATFIRGEGGALQRVIGTVNDISATKQIERKLQKQAGDLRRQVKILGNLYDSVPCGIAQFSMKEMYRIVGVNTACWQIFGFSSQEEFLKSSGSNLLSVIYPEDRQAIEQVLTKCMNTGKPIEYENRILLADGTVGIVYGKAGITETVEGEFVLQCVFVDVTRRRKQERQLRETNAELEHLLDNLPVGVVISEFGKQINVKFLNEQLKSILGISEIDLKKVSEKIKQEEQLGYNEYLAARDTDQKRMYLDETAKMIKGDGGEIWVRYFAHIFFDERRNATCYCALADVTEQMKNQREYNRQNEYARMLTDSSDMMLFDYDAEKDILKYSTKLPSGERRERLMENFIEQPKSTDVLELSERNKITEEIRAAIAAGKGGNFDIRGNFLGTGSLWFRIYYTMLTDLDGKIYRIIGRGENIEAEREKDKKIIIEQERRNAVLAHTLFVCEFDVLSQTATLLNESEQMQEHFYPFEKYVFATIDFGKIYEEDRDMIKSVYNNEYLLDKLQRGESEISIQYRILDKYGKWVWVECTMHIMKNSLTDSIKGIAYIEVIEEQKILESRASIDPVSGLLNRATLESKAEEMLSKEQGGYAFFLFDLDNFKTVNDTYGHAQGDALLLQIGSILKDAFGEETLLGRIGGDEFVALLSVDHSEEIVARANRSLEKIGLIAKEFGWSVPVTASLGIAVAAEKRVSFSALYNSADQALYEAKAAGKNRYSVCFR